MKIHEYQAKEIFRQYGVTTPRGQVAFSPAEAENFAKELGTHGVRVNVIAPGFVITGATQNRPVEWQQSFLKARALSREQKPDDLVGTALYLLSDLSGFVSGQTIVVDGGHIMY